MARDFSQSVVALSCGTAEMLGLVDARRQSLTEEHMTSRWYIQDNHCLLDGLIRKSFWPGIRALVADGEAQLAGSLLAALQTVIGNRSRFHYPSPDNFFRSVTLHLIEMPFRAVLTGLAIGTLMAASGFLIGAAIR